MFSAGQYPPCSLFGVSIFILSFGFYNNPSNKNNASSQIWSKHTFNIYNCSYVSNIPVNIEKSLLKWNKCLTPPALIKPPRSKPSWPHPPEPPQAGSNGSIHWFDTISLAMLATHVLTENPSTSKRWWEFQPSLGIPLGLESFKSTTISLYSWVMVVVGW